MNSRSIPFEIPNVNHGFVIVKGLFHIKDEELVLEFDERDGFVGVMKSDLKVVTVPFSEVDSITLIKKLFITNIEIIASSMKSFQNVPGAEQGRIVMKISRKDRQRAESILSNARLKLSEYKLKKMDEDL